MTEAFYLQTHARIDVKQREDLVRCERFVGGYLAQATVNIEGDVDRVEATKRAIIQCAAEAGRFMLDNGIKEQF